LVFKEGIDYVDSQDELIDSFIDFAVDNNISYVGAIGIGCFFCAEESFNVKLMKRKFIDYLKSNHTDKILVIIFEDFDEEKVTLL